LRRGRRSASSGAADPAAFSRALDEAAAHAAAGRLDAAAQVYRRLERQAPDDIRAPYSLAVIDLRHGRLDRARVRLEAVVAREPGLAPAQHNLAAVRQHQGDWAGAAEAYAQATALQPVAGESRVGLAMALAALGRTEEAIAQNRILAGDPVQRWSALTRIALLNPASIDEADLAAMQQAAEGRDLNESLRAGLLFALGDVLEHRGEHGAAFDAYAAGNRLKRAAFDIEAVARANAEAVRLVREVVTPAFVAAHAGHGSRSAAPIFVIGMPRCGSTLIEQIAASHPGVQGLGETGVLPALLERGYPRDAAGFRDLAARYLDAMRARGWDGASRFVDKTLENYLHAGLIGLLFPNARILHVARDPVDLGFACYRQLFVSGNETLYDLADIGAEYVRFRDLLDHWRSVLPGRIDDVGYEALVGDPDREIPRLITETLGLSWDPGILRFHERASAVQTASAAQVRRPLYQSSVQRARRQAERLQPLIAALGEYAEI
jgi:tetratricopeptide (TPR) repeat protein